MVANKCDLPGNGGQGAGGEGRGERWDLESQVPAPRPSPLVPIATIETSALTGEGCPGLSALIVRLLGEGRIERSAGRLAADFRRREVLARARSSLRAAAEALEDGLGLACAADDLREAARTVARHFEPGAGRAELDEGVINRIFARFCVGK